MKTNFDDFTDFVEKFSGETLKNPNYWLLQTLGEVGEIAGKEAKKVRGDDFQDFEKLLMLEIGDSFYCLVAYCLSKGFDISEILAMNVEKLKDREKRGVVKGSGDER